MHQSFARDELVYEFSNAGIRCIEVQGTRLRFLYLRPEYRTMSDIDFIIELKNLQSAGKILEKLEYNCSIFRDVELNGFRNPNIHVELHTSFFPLDSDYHGKMGDPFAGLDASDAGSVSVSRKTMYLYNVLHIAKHYYFAGCGIRRILDMYFLNKEYSDIFQSDEIKVFFENLGLAEFVRDISLLADCWFGEDKNEVPDSLSEMADIIKKQAFTVHFIKSLIIVWIRIRISVEMSN